MIAWLFYKADSATSTACIVIAVCVFLVGRLPSVARKPGRVLYLTIAGIVLIGLLEFLFGIKETVVTMLGRRPDLTTRVPMWEDLIAMAGNPIIGFGYESFWLGARREIMDEKWGITMQAHNGYLEMYLNMGLLGLFFLSCWILSGLRKIKGYFSVDYAAASLRFCFVIVVLVYNWTEATFYGVSIMWMLLLIGVMDAPSRHPSEKLLGKLEVQKFSKFRSRVAAITSQSSASISAIGTAAKSHGSTSSP